MRKRIMLMNPRNLAGRTVLMTAIATLKANSIFEFSRAKEAFQIRLH